MFFELPYGRGTLPLSVDDASLAGVLTSRIEEYDPHMDQAALVEEAAANPIGSAPLCELAKGKARVTMIASDHTRPVPSRLIMPVLLREIRKGNPDAQITILIATGCHRGTTAEELAGKFGPEIVANEHIVVHDCDDMENMVLLGTLPSGGACMVNRLAVETDLLVAEGFIEPHFFAGYSGGRKSVLPGVASRECVMANHCSEFIAHPMARQGFLDGNPIHADMEWAARKAGLAFILNVVLNGSKQVIHAVAGDAVEAHRAGCDFLEGLCVVPPVPADIVVSTNGGYPLDQNIYQAVKGMTAAEATVNEGGVIIMAAASADGHGSGHFCKGLQAGDDMDALMVDILSRGRGETTPDQWQYQVMIRVLQRARIIYISEADDALVRSLHMTPAHDTAQALELARQMLGKEHPTVTVIPDGIAVVVK